jgi:hypothetical protein
VFAFEERRLKALLPGEWIVLARQKIRQMILGGD